MYIYYVKILELGEVWWWVNFTLMVSTGHTTTVASGRASAQVPSSLLLRHWPAALGTERWSRMPRPQYRPGTPSCRGGGECSVGKLMHMANPAARTPRGAGTQVLRPLARSPSLTPLVLVRCREATHRVRPHMPAGHQVCCPPPCELLRNIFYERFEAKLETFCPVNTNYFGI